MRSTPRPRVLLRVLLASLLLIAATVLVTEFDLLREAGDLLVLSVQGGGSTGPGRIPKILHQIFASELVLAQYKPLIESCLRLNPDWQYYLWTDADIDLLIGRHYPHLADTFRRFKHRLERSDAARYLVLHRFGGIYIDMDTECRKPFYPALASYGAFVDQEATLQTQILWNRSFTAMNSAMGATAGHPFFNATIARLVSQADFGSPVFTTGPLMLTSVLENYWRSGQSGGQYPVDLLPEYLMSPVMDESQNLPWRCCHGFPSTLDLAQSKLARKRPLTEMEKGCLQLEARDWQLLSNITDDTVSVHRFLHLGYRQRSTRRRHMPVFHAGRHFWRRVHFYMYCSDRCLLIG